MILRYLFSMKPLPSSNTIQAEYRPSWEDFYKFRPCATLAWWAREIIFTHVPPEHSRGIPTQSQLSAPARTPPPRGPGRVYGDRLHSRPHLNSLHSHYRHCTEVASLCTCLQSKSGRRCVSNATFPLSRVIKGSWTLACREHTYIWLQNTLHSM